MPIRTLSDSDVEAISIKILEDFDWDIVAEKVELRMVERFQLETGKAVWGTVRRWAIKVVIWMAIILMAHQAGVTRPFVESVMARGN